MNLDRGKINSFRQRLVIKEQTSTTYRELLHLGDYVGEDDRGNN